ncbi:hypothetical protein [Maliponia aquimaris]|uniref:Uncharacterized protein n=1 Tax=Maliponia aquimaris TaxID=1673631 RepID=A0A238KV59_9RHOB|nr:hypothetical protein [Maliponia aquimaris]SMX46587.1 hypothetical protein MAA8898_03448 [Maliponia aquimaris]
MRFFILLAALVLAGPLWAQSASLFAAEGAARAPLIAMRPAAHPAPGHAASLFSTAPRAGLFAPLPEEPRSRDPDRAPAYRALSGSAVEQLRALIAEAEAGPADYDAVIHGARVKTPKLPTEMTVQEIYDWIDATPGQPHAIGRYQFIPDTLRRVVKETGISPRARFTPDVQDRLADQLLAEAGINALENGEITRRSFMYRLAKIWAGFPLPSGESYYQGYAGNKATMTWARFDGAMARIFPG